MILLFFLDERSSSLVEIAEYDTDYVRESLREYGYPPGPIVASTKQVYVKKLNQILHGQTKQKRNDEPINNSSGIFSIVLISTNKFIRITYSFFSFWKVHIVCS